jgi:glycosyltransferase involved in cell wall biosynthesis
VVVAPIAEWMQREYRPHEDLMKHGVRLVETPRRATREREALSALCRHPQIAVRMLRAPFYGVQTEMYLLDMERAIIEELRSTPDVVTVEHDFGVRLGDRVPPSMPKVLMTHNVSGAYYRSRAASESAWRRWLYLAEARRASAYLRARIDAFTRIVAVSDEDALALGAQTAVPVSVLPNGSALEPVPRIAPGARPTLLFTGTMSWPPNHEGILWFVSEVWPHVVAEIPGARLLVVGRRPDQKVNSLAAQDPRIHVTGEVPEMQPYYQEATVVVAPLLSGSGTRLKLLDAFAVGRPVVSTTMGAAGLAVSDGHEVLIADSPTAFARQVLLLLGDGALRERLVSNAWGLVREHYHWDALAAQYVALLQTAIDDKRSSR